ncbi:MAG: rhomboid family intramembrane serine protease [Halioglobus sp.]|nr:rhomboid family intramembrane serine protease [Halioglobus sp.]
MTEFYPALRVDIQENLLPLSALLHQRGMPHRVIEKGGHQVLEVLDQAHIEPVRECYGAWQRGELQIELRRRARTPAAGDIGSTLPLRAPVTLALIALSILGFLLVLLPMTRELVTLFAILPAHVAADPRVVGGVGGEYWRLVTPVFLHFGWLHIVFNCLWLWYFGQRVEAVIGAFNMFMLVVVIALVSNITQAQFTGSGIAGGMSGVVYGVLGFAWAAPLLQPAWRIQPAAAVMLFLVLWLVAGFLGLVEAAGFGQIGNAAHLSGLVCGLLLGAVFGLVSRLGGGGGNGDKEGDASL